jgi:hypothetical protein
MYQFKLPLTEKDAKRISSEQERTRGSMIGTEMPLKEVQKKHRLSACQGVAPWMERRLEEFLQRPV